MSDHYDYAIHCEFSHLMPQPVIDTLRYMTRTEDYPFDAPLDHPFFAAQDFGDAGVYEPWRTVLQSDCGESTSYFARFFRFDSPRVTWGPGFGDPYILDYRVDVHEDEEGDYVALLEWLATVSTTQGFVGYSLRQISFDHPTLWYFQNGTLLHYWVTVDHGAPNILPSPRSFT